MPSYPWNPTVPRDPRPPVVVPEAGATYPVSSAPPKFIQGMMPLTRRLVPLPMITRRKLPILPSMAEEVTNTWDPADWVTVPISSTVEVMTPPPPAVRLMMLPPSANAKVSIFS